MAHGPEAPDSVETSPLQVPPELVPFVEELAAKIEAASPNHALLIALGTLGRIVAEDAALVLLVGGRDVRFVNGASDATKQIYLAGKDIFLRRFDPKNPNKP
jgi:hypothetical protein